MRYGILATTFGVALMAGTHAHAADSAIEVGVHGGVMSFDRLDEINTSWIAAPRIGIWVTEGLGFEVDVGISTGRADPTGHGFTAIIPRFNVIGDPVPLSKESPVRPILTVGGGAIIKQLDGDGVLGEEYAETRVEGLASFGAGLVIPIVGPLAARIDARMLVTAARENEQFRQPFLHFEATAGLLARFGLAKDADKDKVADKIDLCVDEPEDMDGFEDEDGCPDVDNDADGVLDAADQCPDAAEDMDGFEDSDGCLEEDNDDDTLLDADDRCPDEPGSTATEGCPDADGDLVPDIDDRCPEQNGDPAYEGCPDTDGDALPDPDDECPEEAGAIEAFGCPDADTDLVPDYRDACPDEAANEGIDPLHSDGCASRVFVSEDKIVITETIRFGSGNARISSRSYGLLNDIAVTLRTYPDIALVEVQGHTDDRGDADFNMKLSEERAVAVATYLVEEAGIDAARLGARGYGETLPIADNGTSAGRAENRRVVFVIVEMASDEPETAEEAPVEEAEAAEEAPVEEAETAEEAPVEEAETAEEAPVEEVETAEEAQPMEPAPAGESSDE